MNDYNRGALPDPCLRLDYGFGEEVASVELGDGTGYVRLSDYEKLKAENAELRKQVDDLMHEHERLEQGNAMLLELVRTMVYCYKADEYDGYDCDGCMMNGADTHVSIDGYFACEGLRESLRKLGFEGD